MVKINKKKIMPKSMKMLDNLIEKFGEMTPRVIPLKQTKDDKLKAKLMQKLLVHNWGTIKERIDNEILRTTMRCYLYGTHRWRGYGEKEMHRCVVCGWKTWVVNDPKYYGEMKVYWDKPNL